MNEYVGNISNTNERTDTVSLSRPSQKSVLFVCAYRGARAQIAEYYCRKFGGDRFSVFSAGFEPGPLGGVVLEIMREEQCSLSSLGTKSIFQYFADHQQFDYVISMCQEQGVEQCPVFRRSVDKLYGESAVHIYWNIGDFRTVTGDEAERLEAARKICDVIRDKVYEFVIAERSPMIPALDKTPDQLSRN